MTRFKLQQFEWGFRMYDSNDELPADGELARYDINMEEAELVEAGGTINIIDGEVVVTPVEIEE